MKKLNTYEFYRLGDILTGFTNWEPKEPTKAAALFFRVASLRSILHQFYGQESLVSSASKRAILGLLNALTDVGIPEQLPENVEDWDKLSDIQPWQFSSVPKKAKELETVLANDLPGLATYHVTQQGLYSTDDLISHAHIHIPKNLRLHLQTQAETDIDEAGKCLAFERSTASAFHMWRAVESAMDQYHQKLTGESFADAGITRNWGQYIPALGKAGADNKITEVLDMIRDKYRNPISHPSENVDIDEAFNLFGFGIGIIGQILQEISKPKALPLIAP